VGGPDRVEVALRRGLEDPHLRQPRLGRGRRRGADRQLVGQGLEDLPRVRRGRQVERGQHLAPSRLRQPVEPREQPRLEMPASVRECTEAVGQPLERRAGRQQGEAHQEAPRGGALRKGEQGQAGVDGRHPAFLPG
jgi:hypothetical protein